MGMLDKCIKLEATLKSKAEEDKATVVSIYYTITANFGLVKSGFST